MNKLYWMCLLASASIMVSCHNDAHKGDEHDHEHETEAADKHDHEGEKHEPGVTVFAPEKAEAVGLKTQEIVPGAFTNVIKTSGQILAAQGSESTIVATVPGVVSFGKTQFAEGMAINKGGAILSLASDKLADGDVAIKAKATYEQAREAYERMKDLVGSQIVSRQDYEQSKLDFEKAESAWKAIEDKQTAHGVAVVSPISGYLKSLQVKEGDYVNVGQPLAVITQSQRLRLRAEVSEKYYSQLSAVRTANFKTPYDDQVYKLEELNGRLISTAKSAEDNSFYLPVTFEFQNRGAIIPGSFVEIYLLTDPKENVISIPHSALIEEQGVFSVYIRLDEDCYKKVPVECGMDNGKEVEILNGLHEGENVVTDGAYQIKLASASNAIPPHSHHH